MASLLLVVIVTAIVFDFINGFHDAANAIATVVSTGVLPIRTAVMTAGIFNFMGAVTGTAVAKTIAAGFADPAVVSQTVVLGALIGAIAWNLMTWWKGIPSSSSHALVGALGGAVVAHAGVHAFKWTALVEKVLVPLVVSPLLGFLVAFWLMIGLVWGARRMKPTVVHTASRRMQLVSAGAMAFSHGSNDAQKSMGIITLALLSFVTSSGGSHGGAPAWAFPAKGAEVPLWVIIVCAAAIGLGTMGGGKRIIKTMGTKSSASRRSRDSRPRRPAPSPSWGRATSASPSPRPTASTRASWESARASGSARSGGASPGTSSWRGS